MLNNIGVNNKYIDFLFLYMVGLYYINDCDGLIYVWILDGLEEILLKQGRFVVFDGLYEYVSSCFKELFFCFVCIYNFLVL